MCDHCFDISTLPIQATPRMRPVGPGVNRSSYGSHNTNAMHSPVATRDPVPSQFSPSGSGDSRSNMQQRRETAPDSKAVPVFVASGGAASAPHAGSRRAGPNMAQQQWQQQQQQQQPLTSSFQPVAVGLDLQQVPSSHSSLESVASQPLRQVSSLHSSMESFGSQRASQHIGSQAEFPLAEQHAIPLALSGQHQRPPSTGSLSQSTGKLSLPLNRAAFSNTLYHARSNSQSGVLASVPPVATPIVTAQQRSVMNAPNDNIVRQAAVHANGDDTLLLLDNLVGNLQSQLRTSDDRPLVPGIGVTHDMRPAENASFSTTPPMRNAETVSTNATLNPPTGQANTRMTDPKTPLRSATTAKMASTSDVSHASAKPRDAITVAKSGVYAGGLVQASSSRDTPPPPPPPPPQSLQPLVTGFKTTSLGSLSVAPSQHGDDVMSQPTASTKDPRQGIQSRSLPPPPPPPPPRSSQRLATAIKASSLGGLSVVSAEHGDGNMALPAASTNNLRQVDQSRNQPSSPPHPNPATKAMSLGDLSEASTDPHNNLLAAIRAASTNGLRHIDQVKVSPLASSRPGLAPNDIEPKKSDGNLRGALAGALMARRGLMKEEGTKTATETRSDW